MCTVSVKNRQMAAKASEKHTILSFLDSQQTTHRHLKLCAHFINSCLFGIWICECTLLPHYCYYSSSSYPTFNKFYLHFVSSRLWRENENEPSSFDTNSFSLEYSYLPVWLSGWLVGWFCFMIFCIQTEGTFVSFAIWKCIFAICYLTSAFFNTNNSIRFHLALFAVRILPVKLITKSINQQTQLQYSQPFRLRSEILIVAYTVYKDNPMQSIFIRKTFSMNISHISVIFFQIHLRQTVANIFGTLMNFV